MKTNHNPPAAGEAAHIQLLSGFSGPSESVVTIRTTVAGYVTQEDLTRQIQTACNNHAALVEALEGCVKWMEFTIEQLQTHNQGDRLNWGGPISKARAALAAASSTP